MIPQPAIGPARKPSISRLRFLLACSRRRSDSVSWYSYSCKPRSAGYRFRFLALAAQRRQFVAVGVGPRITEQKNGFKAPQGRLGGTGVSPVPHLASPTPLPPPQSTSPADARESP